MDGKIWSRLSEWQECRQKSEWVLYLLFSAIFKLRHSFAVIPGERKYCYSFLRHFKPKIPVKFGERLSKICLYFGDTVKHLLLQIFKSVQLAKITNFSHKLQFQHQRKWTAHFVKMGFFNSRNYNMVVSKILKCLNFIFCPSQNFALP